MILNAVILGIAYFGIYPSLQEKTLNKIMTIDVVLTVLALGVAGALFWGSGVRFSLILFSTNWLIFSLVTLALFEVPLFAWFAKRHDIKLFDDPNDSE